MKGIVTWYLMSQDNVIMFNITINFFFLSSQSVSQCDNNSTRQNRRFKRKYTHTLQMNPPRQGIHSNTNNEWPVVLARSKYTAAIIYKALEL